MGLADDLLVLADRLAKPTSSDPEQASLRRALSTAYYALFHLLVAEVAQLWQGGSLESRRRLERELDHRTMKDISQLFSQPQWTDWTGQQVSVPNDLREVAKAFVSLQQERHVADYNSGRIWARLETQSKVDQAKAAFQSWQAVRTQPVAQDYLLSFLVGTKRRS
jgi:hypothetical protein